MLSISSGNQFSSTLILSFLSGTFLHSSILASQNLAMNSRRKGRKTTRIEETAAEPNIPPRHLGASTYQMNVWRRPRWHTRLRTCQSWAKVKYTVTAKFHLRKFHWENSTYGKFHLWTILPMENSTYGKLHLRKIPPMDNSTYGQFHPWTNPPMDKSTYGKLRAPTTEATCKGFTNMPLTLTYSD